MIIMVIMVIQGSRNPTLFRTRSDLGTNKRHCWQNSDAKVMKSFNKDLKKPFRRSLHKILEAQGHLWPKPIKTMLKGHSKFIGAGVACIER